MTGPAPAGTAGVACPAGAHGGGGRGARAAAGAAAARAGTARRAALAGSAVVVPFALWALAIHGLFFPEGRTVIAGLGPARVTLEGLAYAGAFVLRTAALVAVLLAFSLWADVGLLRAALVRRGVPGQLGYVLAASLGLAATATDRLRRIREAQEVRGLVVGRGPVRRLVAARLQAVPLVLALINEAGERAIALEARGQALPGRRTAYRAEPDSSAQRALRWLLAATSAAIIASVVVPAVARAAA